MVRKQKNSPHNLKVVGSNPTPATIKNVPLSPVEAAVVFC